MSTTLTIVGFWERQLVFAHVGDSRGYLWREGRIEQFTRDHTAVEEAVQAGVIDRSEAAHHPHRHMLVRVVSADPGVPVSSSPPMALRPGDRVLVCSDGLTEAVADVDIAAILADATDAEAATSKLVAAALVAGGPDNVTVVVVDVA